MEMHSFVDASENEFAFTTVPKSLSWGNRAGRRLRS